MKQVLFIFLILIALNTRAQKFDFEKATIASVGKDLRTGKITVVQLTQLYLKRIDSLNPLVNAMITLNPDAMALAKKADKEIKAGKSLVYSEKTPGRLGVPVCSRLAARTRRLPTGHGLACSHHSLPRCGERLVITCRFLFFLRFYSFYVLQFYEK